MRQHGAEGAVLSPRPHEPRDREGLGGGQGQGRDRRWPAEPGDQAEYGRAGDDGGGESADVQQDEGQNGGAGEGGGKIPATGRP